MLKIKTKIRIASLCLMSLQTATAECYDQHSVEMCDGMACVCYSCSDGVSSSSRCDGCAEAAERCRLQDLADRSDRRA
jgi:hypothetical protein